MSDPLEQTTPPATEAPSAPDTQQPAVASAPEPQVAAEDDVDLDALLAEHEASTEQQAPQDDVADTQQPAAQNLLDGGGTDSADMLARLYEIEVLRHGTQIAQRDHRDTVAAIGAIRGDLDPKLYSDHMLAGWLQGISTTEPKVQRAWENRYTDPNGYIKAVNNLAGRFAREHKSKLVDPEATADRLLVADAVRNNGKAASPDMSEAESRRWWANMSDAEFRRESEKIFDSLPR